MNERWTRKRYLLPRGDGFWTRERRAPTVKLPSSHRLNHFLNGIGHGLDHHASHRKGGH